MKLVFEVTKNLLQNGAEWQPVFRMHLCNNMRRYAYKTELQQVF